MKKTILCLLVTAGIISCGGNNDGNATASDSAGAATTTPAAAANPEAEKGLALVAQSDCFTCHKVAEASTGPAYEAVAAKYPNNDAVVDSLAGKIITGGAGNWGQVPMTPHPQLSKEDARTMVKYILSLKK